MNIMLVAVRERTRETSHTAIEVYRQEGRHRELKGLEELKEEYRHVFGADGAIYQKDILASLEHLDLPDDEMDALWDWFAAENIKVSEDEDIEELEEEEPDLPEEPDTPDEPDTPTVPDIGTDTPAEPNWSNPDEPTLF